MPAKRTRPQLEETEPESTVVEIQATDIEFNLDVLQESLDSDDTFSRFLENE